MLQVQLLITQLIRSKRAITIYSRWLRNANGYFFYHETTDINVMQAKAFKSRSGLLRILRTKMV
jgi:hypothetical protein